MDEITLKLNSPITDEQWDDIVDVDFDHTDRIWFNTKHGKEVEFVKVVRCKDCKHRPTSTGADGHIEQGFSLEFPDNVCPCQCDDGWYNWYPSDDFYCGRAERREDALN